jgi:type IV pilus assembly protein PilY1
MNLRDTIRTLLLSAGLACAAHTNARADDTEIFTTTDIKMPANVLLILDTSGSMNTLVEDPTAGYDPAHDYSADGGTCSSDYVYFTTGANPPNCGSSSTRMSASQFKCQAAQDALATATSGFYSGEFIRWGRRDGNYKWTQYIDVNRGSDVECEADVGVHGNGASATNLWPSKNVNNSSTTAGVWVSSAANSWWTSGSNNGTTLRIYSPNYLNFLQVNPPVITTRAAIVQEAATELLNTWNGISVGLMRYDTRNFFSGAANGSGGMVTNAIAEIADNRASLISEIESWHFAGDTPLSETLAEAYRYFSGGNVVTGNASHVCTEDNSAFCPSGSEQSRNSVAAARTGGSASGTTYDSPADYSCQKNFVIYLTDGEPYDDSSEDTFIQGLPEFATKTGGCKSSSVGGRCLEALSEYLYETDLRSDVDDVQNVTSYYIGFGSAFYSTDGQTEAFARLEEAATRGGGQAFPAGSSEDLHSAFGKIADDVTQQTDTLFSAPTVAVNAFNRTQTLDDLYVSVFLPQSTFRWVGNVKKYKVVNETVVDQTGASAVDPATGFFDEDARSYWSAEADGSSVLLGGAANKLPDAASIDDRHVYTLLGSNAYSGAGRDLAEIQDAITDANDEVLELETSDPDYTDLIAWARGIDVRGENDEGDDSGARHSMGDPVHSEPAVLIYSEGSAGTTGYETVVFVTTNDGYLHAIDATAAADGSDLSSSGTELWSFIPQELLPDLADLYENAASSAKHYGLDGPVRLLKYDQDGDGTVEVTGSAATSDRVLLYFSTGRNANVARYYALDVTDKEDPKFLWSLSEADLPGLGQTWSPPTLAKVNVSGATQNPQKLVLIFGGGYDADEDGYNFNADDASPVGNRIFMVDAKSGALLWSAGDSGTDLELERMTHSIPSPVSVLDIDNDGYADRMYVGDMAGQLWRFDITNGANAAGLVAGGVLASLGAKDEGTPTMANTRRLYASPDVALIEPVGGYSFLNVAIGSGYRGHPLNTEVEDRLYSFRDYHPFTPMSQDDYDAWDVVLDADMTDITGDIEAVIAEGAAGWKLDLPNSGEKVLASARTLNNTVYFTTYEPSTAVVEYEDPCLSGSTGTNRLYAISVFNGAPVKDRNGDHEIDADDSRSEDLGQGGIAPGVSLLFPGGEDGAANTDVVVMSGPEVVDICTGCRSLRKTYWRETAAQ